MLMGTYPDITADFFLPVCLAFDWEWTYLYRTTPLFLVLHDKKEKYCYSDLELATYLDTVTSKYEVQRYKGLGEMSASQLCDTTMSPDNRVIKQVNIDDAAEAERMFTILMGDK